MTDRSESGQSSESPSERTRWLSPASGPAPPLRFGEPAGRWVLLATVLGSSMAMLDGTVVNLALPRIADDLDASFGGLQWILNGYTLALAALILVGGGLGDRFGRRRIFIIGAIAFTAASVLCAVAVNVPMLIAARVAQGVGAALLTPGSLAIIEASFAQEDRGRAIGAWSGLGGVATAIGPFLGGWLVDAASWRYIFLLNVPLGIAVVVVALRHVPESRDPNATGGIDVLGAALGALALAGLTLGLSERSWPLAAGGGVLLVAFVLVERWKAHPLVPMSLFSSRTFSGTNAVTLLLYGALGVVFFLLGLVLQGPLGYTPLQAGAATMPITLAMLLLSSRAGALAGRIGPRIPMTVGPLLVAVGVLLLSRIDAASTYVTDVLPGIVVFGLGLALTVAPLTATALGSVDVEHAGVASGVNNAVARTGQLLAVAAVPLVAGFAPGAAVAAEDLLDGFRIVMQAAAATAVLASLIALATVRRTAPPAAEPAPWHCAAGGPPAVPEPSVAART